MATHKKAKAAFFIFYCLQSMFEKLGTVLLVGYLVYFAAMPFLWYESLWKAC